MMGNIENSKQENRQMNKGFSVISVLIAIAFVGILGMLVLYISTANFQMKISDIKSKDSFYTAEKALDEIRVGLQEKVGDAMSVAYISVLEKYADREETSLDGESLNDLRKDEFNKAFVKEISGKLKDEQKSQELGQECYKLEILDGMLDSKPADSAHDRLKVTAKNDKPFMKDSVPNAADQEMSKEAGVLLKNLKVVYEDEKGYASIIETDIHLHIPEVTFPEPSTVPDLMSMILVANQGLICEGNNVINGTFYAGDTFNNVTREHDPSIDVTGDVEISGGDYAVCSGDIRINPSADFRCKADELWVNNIDITSAKKVELLGSTYVANDLTINTMAGSTTLGEAMGSTVKIGGSYYGYGSKANWEKARVHKDERYEDRSDTASESSIIVNGKNTTLDMSSLGSLLLAGTSYISGVEKDDTDAVLMGESLSIKGNQLAYLLPSEYLKSEPAGSLTNPMKVENYLLLDEKYLDYMIPASSLGGLTLKDLYNEYHVGVTRQLRQHQDGVYAYYYLHFSDSANASAFFNRFYNDYQKENMDKYLSFYLNPEGGIKINRDVLAHFITKGNVFQFEKDKGSLVDPTDKNGEKGAGNQEEFANKWFSLTRKMVANYDLLSLSEAPDAVSPEKHVFDNLINIDKLQEYLAGTTQKESENESGGYRALIVNNVDDEDYTIRKEEAEKYKLIVATGNIKVQAPNGVDFKGILMAGGKITMGTGTTLQSDPRTAARVFQVQNDEFKKIFWDSEKYVLGNVSDGPSDGDVADDSDTYDLMQSVTYERWNKK